MNLHQPKFACVTYYTPDLAVWADSVEAAKTRWAARHGYPMIHIANQIDHARHAVWTKLIVLTIAMLRYPSIPWLFWSDADAVITNPARSLASVFPHAVPAEVLVIGTKDYNGFNAGTFFVRNSQDARSFLARSYQRHQCRRHHWHEQQAMTEELRTRPGAFLTLPKRSINAYRSEWQPGDLLVHLVNQERTPQIVEEWLTR